MDMKSSGTKTIGPIVVGLVVAAILKLIDQSWGSSIIVGAIVAIALAFLMNRRANAALDSGSSSGSSAPSQADTTALLATAGSAVTGFVDSANEIANPSTKEIAGKIGTSLQGIMTELQKPEKKSAVPVVVDNLIEPAQSLLTEYLFLTKKATAATTPRSTTIEQSIFPAIENASRQTLSLLQDAGAPNITKLTTATTIPFERAVTVPPTGTTEKGSRVVKLGE